MGPGTQVLRFHKMACDSCRASLPLLMGFRIVGIDQARHAHLYRCKTCGAYYEQIAEEWVGPKEVDVEHIRRYYSELVDVPTLVKDSTC